jgi:hypothetical protein
VLTGLIFLCLNYTYFGSLFGVEALKGSIYFNSMILASGDIISFLFVDVIASNFKRRTVFIVCFFFVIVFSLSIYFIHVPKACEDSAEFC